MRKLSLLLLATGIALAGCGSVVDFTPPDTRQPTQGEIDSSRGYVAYIDEIAGKYLRTAGQYSNAAQAPDLLIIGSAAAAATAASFGWSIDIIKAAGLTAAGAFAIRQYYAVDPRVTKLVDAVDGLNCLRGLAQSAESKSLWSSSSEEINGGVRRINNAVQKASLKHASADFTALVATMTTQAKAAAAFAAADANARGILNATAAKAGSAEDQQFVAELPGKVTACVATAS